MQDSFIDEIEKVLRETGRLREEPLRHDATLAELGIDSLDALDIVFRLEERLRISFGPEDLATGTTLRELAECVHARVLDRGEVSEVGVG